MTEISAARTDAPTIERLEACPVCGSRDLEVWGQGRDRLWGLTKAVFEYDSCRSCGVLFARDRPTSEAAGDFYPPAYAPHTGEMRTQAKWSPLPEKLDRKLGKHALKRLGFPAFEARIQAFHAALGDGSTVLDFGCGSGAFLDVWRAKGCQTIGMDFAPQALAEAKRRGHATLSANEEGWKSLTPGSIDFARMNHVVEHLYAPSEVLAHLRRVLKPGGRMHVATPNPDGVSARRYKSAWFSLDCPRHTILFPPQRLAAMMEEAGFVDIEVVHEPIAKDMVRSWANQQVDRGVMASELVEGLDRDGLLNLRFSGAIRDAVREGRADRYHILCRAP